MDGNENGGGRRRGTDPENPLSYERSGVAPTDNQKQHQPRDLMPERAHRNIKELTSQGAGKKEQ